MTTTIELMRAAVEREGGLCVVCGGRCGPDDARRRSDPDQFGDCAMNWVAMCRACRAFLAGKAPPPAQRVFHYHDAGRIKRAWRRFWNIGLFVLSVSVYAALWGIAGYTIWSSIDSPLEAFGTAVLMLFLIALAYRVAVVRDGPPTIVHHHTHAPQRVWFEEKSW